MKQPDQYDWVTAYFKGRGLQSIWQRATFVFTASQAALPVLLLGSPIGPAHTTLRTAFVVISALGFVGAVLWLLHWPTRRQSIVFSMGATAAIAATCLSLASPYSGLMGCTTFAILGGFIAYFHTGYYVLANFAVAMVCAGTLAHRLVAASDDVALASAAMITVLTLNIGVPFGIRSLVHTLRSDLQTSDRDSLTGLHNRRSFYDAVHELMTLHGRSADRYLVIAVIDLDNFKKINDTQGHAVGDQALIAVGRTLQENCDPSAVIGRIGGEEFVIVDVDTTPNPVRMAERLCRAVAEVPFSITASIGTSGVALDIPPAVADTQLIDDLIRTSDAAMYEAKRAGGNQVRHSAALLPRGAR